MTHQGGRIPSETHGIILNPGLLQRSCGCGAQAGLTGKGGQCESTPLIRGAGDRGRHPSNTLLSPSILHEALPFSDDLRSRLPLAASNSASEQEADQIADQVIAGSAVSIPRARTAALQAKTQARTASGAVSGAIPSGQTRAGVSSGSPLTGALRRSMESKFQHDFSNVRIHTDAQAATTARQLKAVAFTTGRDIFFDQGYYRPDTEPGQWLLAHELTHVVQHRLSHGHPPAALAVMRLTPDRFMKRLSQTPEQEKVIEALFKNTQFQALWSWLEGCGNKKRDHGPIRLRVRRVRKDGTEVFGLFKPKRGVLIINPKKREVQDNPLELVDTIIHELIHAISWALRSRICPDHPQPNPLTRVDRALVPDIPPDKQSQAAPPLADVKGQFSANVGPRENLELKELVRSGPSASDPCQYFQDLNASNQQTIIQILLDIKQETRIGKPTLTFVNEILRRDIEEADPATAAVVNKKFIAGKIVAWFMRCRDEVCFEAGECTQEMIAARGGQLCELKGNKRDRQRDVVHCMETILKQHLPPEYQRVFDEERSPSEGAE